MAALILNAIMIQRNALPYVIELRVPAKSIACVSDGYAIISHLDTTFQSSGNFFLLQSIVNGLITQTYFQLIKLILNNRTEDV